MSLRFEMRAYEDTDACRLAAIVQELTTDAQTTVTRDAVVARWVERYPRHATQTGKQSIRGRISKILTNLKLAGVLQVDEGDLTVLNSERLRMAARNLAIVEDAEGVALPPSRWERRPEVPEHLKQVQDVFEASRQQTIDARRT